MVQVDSALMLICVMVVFSDRQIRGDVSQKLSCQARAYLPSFRVSMPLAATNVYCLVKKARV